MYLSVTMIVLGEVLLTGSRALLAYWAVWFLAANLFVIGYEGAHAPPALRAGVRTLPRNGGPLGASAAPMTRDRST
jgi:hypothetical protein